MSSTAALPLITAVTDALTGVRYTTGDTAAKFLTDLHDKGYHVVALDTPLPAVAELRGIYADIADGRAEMPERVA